MTRANTKVNGGSHSNGKLALTLEMIFPQITNIHTNVVETHTNGE